MVTQLKNVNTTISALEDQLTDEYRRSLEGQLEQRRAELKAHDDVKPGEVKTSQDAQEQQAMEVVEQDSPIWLPKPIAWMERLLSSRSNYEKPLGR